MFPLSLSEEAVSFEPDIYNEGVAYVFVSHSEGGMALCPTHIHLHILNKCTLQSQQ